MQSKDLATLVRILVVAVPLTACSTLRTSDLECDGTWDCHYGGGETRCDEKEPGRCICAQECDCWNWHARTGR